MTSVLRWEDPAERPRASRWQEYRPAADQLKASAGKWAVIFEGRHVPAQSLSTAIKNGSGPFSPKGAFQSKTRTVTEVVNGEVDKFVRAYARYVGTEEVVQ